MIKLPDPVNQLCSKYKFSEMIRNKKKDFADIMKLLLRAYELFYGSDTSIPVDLVKEFFRNLVEISPESFYMRSEIPKEIADRVINRVVEEIYETAKEYLVQSKDANYVC